MKYRALGALVALPLLLSACAQSDATTPAPPQAPNDKIVQTAVPVEIVTPTLGEMQSIYAGTATLEAEADADVVARVGGQVERIYVEEGASVRAGQILAALDARQLRLQALQARAQLAKVERDYQRQLELSQKGLIAASAIDGLRYDLDNLRPLLGDTTGTVLVQASPTAEETEFLIAVAQVSRGLVRGVVGWVDLAAPAAPEAIAALAARPAVKGVRPMLGFIEETGWILRPEVQPALKALARHGDRKSVV